MEIANGVYNGFGGLCSLKENDNGSLVLSVKYKFEDGTEKLGRHTLATAKDGIRTKVVDALKKWSGWDGSDLTWFVDRDLSACEVDLVVINEPSIKDKDKLWPNIKYVNPRGSSGGGAGAGRPEPGDARAISAKWGSKFRALAGPVPPTTRQAPPQSAPPKAPTAQQPPPARRAGPATPPPKVDTMASVWELFTALAKYDADQQPERKDAIEDQWFGFCDSVGPNQANFTSANWAKVKAAVLAHFEVNAENLPF